MSLDHEVIFAKPWRHSCHETVIHLHSFYSPIFVWQLDKPHNRCRWLLIFDVAVADWLDLGSVRSILVFLVAGKRNMTSTHFGDKHRSVEVVYKQKQRKLHRLSVEKLQGWPFKAVRRRKVWHSSPKSQGTQIYFTSSPGGSWAGSGECSWNRCGIEGQLCCDW